MALEAYRAAENIEADDAAVDEEIKRLKAQYPQNAEDIDKEYGNERGRGRLKQMLSSRKAVNRLVEMATAG